MTWLNDSSLLDMQRRLHAVQNYHRIPFPTDRGNLPSRRPKFLIVDRANSTFAHLLLDFLILYRHNYQFE